MTRRYTALGLVLTAGVAAAVAALDPQADGGPDIGAEVPGSPELTDRCENHQARIALKPMLEKQLPRPPQASTSRSGSLLTSPPLVACNVAERWCSSDFPSADRLTREPS